MSTYTQIIYHIVFGTKGRVPGLTMLNRGKTWLDPMKFRFCVSLFLLNCVIGLAQAPQRDMRKEDSIVAHLRGINSAAVPIFIAGTAAMDSMNYVRADSLYSQVSEMAPTFDAVLRRLGSIKTQMGSSDEGIALCEKALEINRSSDNIIMLAQGLSNDEGLDQATAAQNLNRAIQLLEEGRNMPTSSDFEYTYLLADCGMRLNDLVLFERETNRLMERHPDKMASHYLNAILAATKEDWKKAESEIRIAEEKGLDKTTVGAFLDNGVNHELFVIRAKGIFLWTFLGWIIGLAALFLFGVILSSLTLSTVERQIKSGGSLQTGFVRNLYRWMINISGIYYYLSLPIVLVLLIVAVGGALYLFFAVGRLPIYFLFLIVASGGITIFYMVKTLIVRPKTQDDGRELMETEAPGLFELTREVARDMNTRPIEEIRITPESDLAVYERGSWRMKMSDKGKRVLIIGTGVMRDFRVDDFRAVLAHEYGHFSHRDTAGGEVAFRVRRDIHLYAYALAVSGQARWWNLAYQFLRLYDFIYRRISHGATRLQEILADRVAAQMYGERSFVNGLSHVVRKTIEFVLLARTEIDDARKNRRPFANLYELNIHSEKTIEEKYTEAINRKTTNDDTHPSPTDRFRYIAGLGAGKGNRGGYVKELFTDWNALTAEQTNVIEQGWKNAAWED